MCEKAVVKSPSLLQYMPDHLKAQEMCDDPVCRRPWLLKYVPDWFITKQQIKVCFDHCGDDVIKWDNGYQKLKAQKAKIKEEIILLLRTHQYGGIGVSLKMRKKNQKNCWDKQGRFVSCDRIQKIF